jgi:hypothetical protein
MDFKQLIKEMGPPASLRVLKYCKANKINVSGIRTILKVPAFATVYYSLTTSNGLIIFVTPKEIPTIKMMY